MTGRKYLRLTPRKKRTAGFDCLIVDKAKREMARQDNLEFLVDGENLPEWIRQALRLPRRA